MANLLTFHPVLDSLRGLWHQARPKLVTRCEFFEHLRVLTHHFYFPHWTALLKERPAASLARGPTRA